MSHSSAYGMAGGPPAASCATLMRSARAPMSCAGGGGMGGWVGGWEVEQERGSGAATASVSKGIGKGAGGGGGVL